MIELVVGSRGRCFLSIEQLSPSALPGKPLELVSCHHVLFFRSTQRDNTAPEGIITKNWQMVSKNR